MKTTELLKEETKVLERAIFGLIDDFIQKNGSCEIRIDINQDSFTELGSGKNIITDLNVNVILNIQS